MMARTPKNDLSLVPSSDLVQELMTRHDALILGLFQNAGANGEETCAVDFYGRHRDCLAMVEELRFDIMMHLKQAQRPRMDG